MSAEEPDKQLMRVSHADRDRMVEILRDAAADGRLDTDELEERVERALTARTFADLEPLTEGLPVAAPGVADDHVVHWQAAGQRFRREGAWTVPKVIELGVIGGSARLDYTQARLPEGGQSTLRLAASGSRVRLIVPPGVAVDLSGVAATGGRIRDHAARHATPGTPVTHVIVVTGATFGGSLRVEASRAK
ncbi:DUF1707 SHOCT-like domain-containing protein [Jiangella anatolica]|uniref:DUF1707 domain-containing protein n=1 Tax=Jiangella anatolica TaxID=2670374 RepID=A0A2W2BIS6_9ACTN|nr:DUF1707 domain-containing protein [Jiangella anatolica]PZF80218.1 hypothetical protein C1I92_27205 [Jiangella anatolica]